MKKILIIKGHPREDSFCNALVDRYVTGTKTNNAEIQILDLRDMQLEPWLKYDWARNHHSIPTSDDLERAKQLITWSEHLVFAYPTYWAMPPALLTLFLEMIIVSGFAFKYHEPYFGAIPHVDRLLKGRTASILATMDSPPFFMELHDHDPGGKMMKDIFRFTGIELKEKQYFGSVVLSTEGKRKEWLDRAFAMGKEESN